MKYKHFKQALLFTVGSYINFRILYIAYVQQDCQQTPLFTN